MTHTESHARSTVVTEFPCTTIPQVIVVEHDVDIRVLVQHEDRLRLRIEGYVKQVTTRIENRYAWVAPTSLTVTLVTTLLTSSFQSTFGIPKQFWPSIYLVGLGACFSWLGKVLYRLARNHVTKKATDIDEFFKMLTEHSESRTVSMPLPVEQRNRGL